MEPVTRSRKRKQRPSKPDPFTGIFTRSRSQIYFYRHRSGYARPDSIRNRNNLIKSRDTVNEVTSHVTQVSVKDLRARRVFSGVSVVSDDDVEEAGGLEGGGFDVIKNKDGNINNLLEGDAGSVGEKDVVKQVVGEFEENKVVGEKDEKGVMNEMISVVDDVADVKGVIMNKSQCSVTSLRGRRKVFKSPTSFNYRRLLPYLMDSGSDDSSSFEIIEATLLKHSKSSNPAPNLVSLKEDEIGPVPNSSNLADGLLNNAKNCDKQFSNSGNAGLVSTVENSDVSQKNKEDVVNDTLLECEQMTPPDSNIYSKSKIDNASGVLVKPASKLALKTCSRKKVLQTPTSFSHRRLLPFLMSVAEDYSCSLKGNQSLKLEKPMEQNQQPLTQSFLHQDEISTTANGTSNSPTSTLIPVDTSTGVTKSVTSVSNDNVLDANGPDKKSSGSISQLEANLQGEGVIISDSCIKMEQSPPKFNLKCVEEATTEATPLRIEQSYSKDHQKKFKESSSSKAICIQQTCSEKYHKKVKESPQQYQLQIFETQGENIKNGILKRTPRGCRGICNCLNCTSFRLHAERSFEFSKNQMHDAEEVALELINDLTCLRSILETTSYSSSLDTVKEKQVKEACEKALYKEQEARARLAQMNEDLSIHCRSMNLLRPKVTFSNKIVEKVISKDEIHGKKSV